MSRLDELPPDQRAALQLLLRQHKSYAEVAALLGIEERAVHDRAHAALAMLAPRRARELAAEQRLEIGDYLLRAQPVAERLRTRALLSSSEPARAWAGELAAQLAPIAAAGLPEIPSAGAPAAGAPPAPAPGAREPQRGGDLRSSAPAPPAAAGAGPGARTPAGGTPASAGAFRPAGLPRSSRTAGAVLLALLAAAVIVAVVLLTGGGSGAKKTSKDKTTAQSSASEPKLDNEIPLLPPDPHASKSIGVVDVVTRESQRYLLIEARNLAPAKGFYYAIWLYNSPTSSLPVTETSSVTNHALGGLSKLPDNAGAYHEILLTRETNPRPTHPGKVVLRGAFSLEKAASPGS